MSVRKMNCHPDRSVAQWRDLLFPSFLHSSYLGFDVRLRVVFSFRRGSRR
jgi:hypothetical protein